MVRAEKRAEISLSRARRPLKVTPSPPKHRHDMLVDGELSPRDLTMDELRLGRGLSDVGRPMSGRHRAVPLSIQNAVNRELQKRLLAEFNKHGQDAIDTIIDIMYQGEGAQISHGQKDGTKRLEAAKYIIERIVGKIPDKMEVTQNVTVWEGMQDDASLFVDVDVVEEINDVQAPEPRPRARGPRTRPNGKAISAD